MGQWCRHRPRVPLRETATGCLSPKAAGRQTDRRLYGPRVAADPGFLFDSNDRLIDWLSRYSPDNEETIVRSFLGRMFFSGDEALKPVRVLSGASGPILLFTSHDHQFVASAPTG